MGAFIPIKYLIDQGANKSPKEVEGFAFETPGWPGWHACVRLGSRFDYAIFDAWIIDHFETGLAISGAGAFEHKEDAPAAMAKVLDEKGREKVIERLEQLGLVL